MSEAEMPASGGGTGPAGAPVSWEPAPAAGGAGTDIYAGRRGAQLTITDALTAGYKFLLNPDFSVPILVIGVVVQLVVIALIVPLIVGLIAGGDSGEAVIGGIIAFGLGAILASIVGGVILNLYGQVWALEASNGRMLRMAAAFTEVGKRWVNILGAGLIVAAIWLASLIVLGLIAAVLGAIGALVFVVGLIAMIYVAIRLSLTGWFAADGSAPMAAVRASWEITNRNLMTIVYWSVAIGIVVWAITFITGIILNLIPLVGPAVTQTLGSAFGFGAGATLYHRIKDA